MTVKQFFSKARQRFSGGGYVAATELDGQGFVGDDFESAVGVLEPEVQLSQDLGVGVASQGGEDDVPDAAVFESFGAAKPELCPAAVV